MAAVKYWCRNGTDLADRSVVRWLLISALLIAPGVRAAQSAEPVPIAPPARAANADDAAHLSERLQALSSYAATFVQEIHGAQGQVLERSTGSVKLLRPAFKWVVDDPFPQVIVGDQALLKVYDPDLEQLTIRPMDDALADTPIALLTRDEVSLSNDFRVFRVAEEGGEYYVVTPLGEDTLYAEIRLNFDDTTLTGLGILDHLGQFTQIRFEPESSVPVLQSSDFQLEVPPGTDVIGG